MKFLFLGMLFAFGSFSALFAETLNYHIVTYNVHNLFDAQHDEGKDDWDFLPKDYPGRKEACAKRSTPAQVRSCLNIDWTEQKLDWKIDNITKAILSISPQGQKPDILILQEVENAAVVQRLVKKLGYDEKDFVISDSKDERGVDVAIAFAKDRKIHLLKSESYHIEGLSKASRAILKTEFLVESLTPIEQKMIVFANHWPSQNNPVSDRTKAAEKLKNLFTAHQKNNPTAWIIAGGDFNTTDTDYPNPIEETLLGKNTIYDIHKEFKNADPKVVSAVRKKILSPGTYYYGPKWEWNLLDHFFVNENLKTKINLASYRIHNPSFLREDYTHKLTQADQPEYRRIQNQYGLDFAQEGMIIKGTPKGFNFYTANRNFIGYSDHFPVSVLITLNP